jgi:hypothetical protein
MIKGCFPQITQISQIINRFSADECSLSQSKNALSADGRRFPQILEKNTLLICEICGKKIYLRSSAKSADEPLLLRYQEDICHPPLSPIIRDDKLPGIAAGFLDGIR